METTIPAFGGHSRLGDAERIAQFLVDVGKPDQLRHLSQARIWFVRSQEAVVFRGVAAAAYVCVPRVQGFMSALLIDLVTAAAADIFEGKSVDFIVRVDADNWDALAYTDDSKAFHRARREPVVPDMDWTIGRERLIFHELSHIVQRTDKDGVPRFDEEDGRPLLALQPHDAEFFHAELECYGPDVCGAEDTEAAIHEGRARQRRAALHVA